MKPLSGNLIEYVVERGYTVVDKCSEVDLCIIDHYGIDESWERAIRPFVKKIMVIDDLANRRHDCDILLDQNVVPYFENRYDKLVPIDCVKLLGPTYLILREEFIEERKHLRTRTGEVKHLLVFMGGTDPTGETMKVLTALQTIDKRFVHVDIVVGNGNPYRPSIQDICAREDYHFHCQIDYIASLMAQADFSIGAGGSTTWERCFVGVSSSSTIVAENQFVSTETAASLGAVWNLGWHKQVTVETYERLLLSLDDSHDGLNRMSEKGLELTDQPSGTNAWMDRILEVIG